MYNIYVYSDLHLEKRKETIKIHPSTTGYNICILAGDIGDPQTKKFWDFIQDTSKNFNLVLFVPGNHEYFNSCVKLTDSLLKSRETENFKVLNKDYIYIKDIDTIIIGCTLWSYIPKYAVWSVVKNISNYKNIWNFTIESNNDMFHEHLDYIYKSLLNSKAQRKIVITHHAPLIKECIKSVYTNSPTMHSYATNIPDVVKLANIWIHGHTHFNTNLTYENCKVYSNQLGYVDVSELNSDVHFTLNS
jgi:predicted phosphodiesterase